MFRYAKREYSDKGGVALKSETSPEANGISFIVSLEGSIEPRHEKT